MTRKSYPSDVSDDEWAFIAPYLTLMREDAPQRDHSLREVFNGLRYIVRTGMQWRMMANDLPPWHTVYQQTQLAHHQARLCALATALGRRTQLWLDGTLPPTGP